MKKMILASLLLICAQTCQCGFIKNNCYKVKHATRRACDRVYIHRGKTSLAVGAITTAVVNYAFSDKIKNVIKKVCNKVSSFFKWVFRIKG